MSVVNCPPPQQESLLVGFVGLLEREPHIERRYCEVSQRYAWLLGYAAKLAERIILDADARLHGSMMPCYVPSNWKPKGSFTTMASPTRSYIE